MKGRGNFTSSKKFGPISTCHRQWAHDGHCHFVHGYARVVEITFACKKLDHMGHCVDFGSLQDVRNWLNQEWDHRLLLAHDDPLMDEFLELEKKGAFDLNILPKEYNPSIEVSCKYIFDKINPKILEKSDGRSWIYEVKVSEHELNSAKFIND